MNILHKLAALFTTIFVFCVLITLLAILVYALCHRKRCPQQRSIMTWKKSQPKIEPAGNPPSLTEMAPHPEHADVEQCWQAVYGHSMLLYTIKEGDKEGSEISAVFSGRSSTEGKNRWLAARISGESILAAVNETVEPATETPYYTPTHSPEHECISIAAEYGSGEEDGREFSE